MNSHKLSRTVPFQNPCFFTSNPKKSPTKSRNFINFPQNPKKKHPSKPPFPTNSRPINAKTPKKHPSKLSISFKSSCRRTTKNALNVFFSLKPTLTYSFSGLLRQFFHVTQEFIMDFSCFLI